MALKANKIFLIILKLVISSGLLYGVLSKTGVVTVVGILKKMSITAFLAATLLYLFAQALSTIRWKLFLPGANNLKKLFSLYMIGSFFNIFLPGILGGDAVKGYYLYQATGKGGLALSSIFMDRYIGFVGLISVCAFAFPFGLSYLDGSVVIWLLPLTVLSFIGASLLIFGLRIGQRIRVLSGFYADFHSYWHQREVIRKSFFLSIVIQLLGIFAVYILAIGLEQSVPILAFLIFLPLIILFTIIPISISGLGVRESASVLLFGLIGIKPEVATAISLSWFLSMSASSLIGFIEYIRYKKEMINIETDKAGEGG